MQNALEMETHLQPSCHLRLKTCIDEYARKYPVDKTIVTLNGDMLGGCLLFSLDKGFSMVNAFENHASITTHKIN